MITTLNDIIAEEKDSYTDKIKNICQLCGKKIAGDWSHYFRFGNICEICSNRCSKVANKEITHEVAMKMLLMRRKQIKAVSGAN
jgi:ribosome-binding protein aMBF1 (putative translation factor)